MAHKGGAGSANTKEALLGSTFFSAELFGPVPESVSENCVKNAQYILRPIKTSSARPSSSAQHHSSASSSSVEFLKMADDTATPNSKKAKASPTQGFRSPINPLWSRHKFPSRSVHSQHKRGGSKAVMPHAIFVNLRRPPLPPPRVRVRMPFPPLQDPSVLQESSL